MTGRPALEAGISEPLPTGAAILVRQRGALWPGSSLDWAQHVEVVEQGMREAPRLLLARIERAAGALAVRSRPLGCVTMSFADGTQRAMKFRNDLVGGLVELLRRVECPRLILAAYNVEQIEVAELVRLSDILSSHQARPWKVEILFRSAAYSGSKYRIVRGRPGTPA